MHSLRPITDLFTHPQNVKFLPARLMVAVLMLETVVQFVRAVKLLYLKTVHPCEENAAPPLPLPETHLGERGQGEGREQETPRLK